MPARRVASGLLGVPLFDRLGRVVVQAQFVVGDFKEGEASAPFGGER